VFASSMASGHARVKEKMEWNTARKRLVDVDAEISKKRAMPAKLTVRQSGGAKKRGKGADTLASH